MGECQRKGFNYVQETVFLLMTFCKLLKFKGHTERGKCARISSLILHALTKHCESQRVFSSLCSRLSDRRRSTLSHLNVTVRRLIVLCVRGSTWIDELGCIVSEVPRESAQSHSSPIAACNTTARALIRFQCWIQFIRDEACGNTNKIHFQSWQNWKMSVTSRI